MPKNLRERPRCRKVLEQMMRDKNCTLQELSKIPRHQLSDGLRIQLLKMLQEETENGKTL